MARRAWKRRSSSWPTRPPILPGSEEFPGRSIFRCRMWASVPLIRPRKAERISPFAEIIAGRGGPRPGGALAASLRRPDPGRREAGDCRSSAQGEWGQCGPRTAGTSASSEPSFPWGRNPMAMQAGVRSCATVAPSPPVRSNRSHRQLRSRDQRCRRGRIPQLLARLGRRSRSRLHPWARTARPLRRPAKHSAQRQSAAHSFTSCWSGLHQCIRTNGTPPPCAGSNGRRAYRMAQPGRKSRTPCAPCSPNLASRHCSARVRSPKRPLPRHCRMDVSSPAPSTGCWWRRAAVSVIDFKTGPRSGIRRCDSALAQGTDERLYRRPCESSFRVGR